MEIIHSSQWSYYHNGKIERRLRHRQFTIKMTRSMACVILQVAVAGQAITGFYRLQCCNLVYRFNSYKFSRKDYLNHDGLFSSKIAFMPVKDCSFLFLICLMFASKA